MSGVFVFMRKDRGGVLTPDTEEAKAVLDKFKRGDVVKVKLSKPRNYRFHKKFFAMLAVGFDNQERYTDFEEFRKEVTILAGFYIEHRHFDGAVSKEARSISFASMDELEFGEVYAKVFHTLIDTILPGADPVQFEAAVNEVLGFQ